MDRTTVEKRLAGARTEGHFVTGTTGRESEPRKVEHLTAIDPGNLCSDCRWPGVCAGDAVCWDDERTISAEVGAYRKQERLAGLGLGDGLADDLREEIG